MVQIHRRPQYQGAGRTHSYTLHRPLRASEKAGKEALATEVRHPKIGKIKRKGNGICLLINLCPIRRVKPSTGWCWSRQRIDYNLINRFVKSLVNKSHTIGNRGRNSSHHAAKYCIKHTGNGFAIVVNGIIHRSNRLAENLNFGNDFVNLGAGSVTMRRRSNFTWLQRTNRANSWAKLIIMPSVLTVGMGHDNSHHITPTAEEGRTATKSTIQ